MIISHQSKFIFIHIHKCAGTSITYALNPYLGQGDIVLGATPEGEKLSEEYRQKKGLHKHSKAIEAKEVLGDKTWNNYFKFAFVRNPWDRLVSKYHWWLTTAWDDRWGTASKIKSMKDFSEYILSDLDPDKQESLLDFVLDAKGNVIVDYLGRFERLNPDFAYICGKLGFPNIALPHQNHSVHASYLEYYKDPHVIKLVNQWFEQEIKVFKYDFARLLSPRPEMEPNAQMIAVAAQAYSSVP